jgi:hypothetical protein
VTVWIATCVGVFRRGNCKLIVVKPARRKGYMPCNVKVSTVKGARRRGHRSRSKSWRGARGSEPRPWEADSYAGVANYGARPRLAHVGNLQGKVGVSWRSEKQFCSIGSAGDGRTPNPVLTGPVTHDAGRNVRSAAVPSRTATFRTWRAIGRALLHLRRVPAFSGAREAFSR